MKIGEIFRFKHSNIFWFMKTKNGKIVHFKKNDKILILKKRKISSKFSEYYFITFHFKKGIIYFPFMKDDFTYSFNKVC